MFVQPCIFISRCHVVDAVSTTLDKIHALCPTIILPATLAQQKVCETPVHILPDAAQATKGNTLFAAAALARELQCTHIITLELDTNKEALHQELTKFFDILREKPEAIINGTRDFTAPVSWRMRFERCMSSFWMRVQTGEKVRDMHSPLRAYPVHFFDFARIQDKSYAFEAEALVRAAWGGYTIAEIPAHMPTPSTWQGPSIVEYFKLIATNVRLTLRALTPLPFKRYNATRQESVSLKRPLESLRHLMDDPYNRANPKELARTAAIAIAVLTVPAPILQSIALLLFIGWFRLNRLCALAMIPFTWPPFLPAMAILVGYRLRHGHWLTEFSVQTLGYEAGERLWEWVIGSLALTPVFALVAGTVVGTLAYSVARKK